MAANAAAPAANADPLTVTTEPNCTIIDFGILAFKPSKFAADGEQKYTCRVLFPKGSSTEKMLRDAEEVAKAERWGNKRPPVGYRAGVQDGDATDANGQRLHPDYYAGQGFITAKSARPVTAWVGKERRKAEGDDFYSGMQGLAVVRAFTYDRESRGCSFGLNLIWKTGPGKKITSGVDAEAAALAQAAKVTWSDDDNLGGADLDRVL
jgi:hypothetical protein